MQVCRKNRDLYGNLRRYQLKMAAAGFLVSTRGSDAIAGLGLPVQLGNGMTISFEVDLCNGKVAA